MASFSDLFGDDRDIVQSIHNTDTTMTGATAGQLLRVASNGIELESFTSSGNGVSGTARTFPIFDSSADGVGDSAMSQQNRSNHAGVTTVRIGGIGGQLYSGFGRLTNSFDGATLIIPVTANSFPDQGTAFFAVPGGSGFHGPLQYTTWRNGSGDGIFQGDETFSTNTGAYAGDFISFQVGDSYAQLATLRADLTAAADTTTLTLGGSGNINLGFEVAVSSDFVVQTYGDINVDTTLTMSGDLDVAGDAQLSGNTSIGGTLTVTGLSDDGFVRVDSGLMSSRDLVIADVTDVTSLGGVIVKSIDAFAARGALALHSATTIAANTTGNISSGTFSGTGYTNSFDILTSGTMADGSDSSFIGVTEGKIKNQSTTSGSADFRIWAGVEADFLSLQMAGNEVTDGSVLYIIRS